MRETLRRWATFAAATGCSVPTGCSPAPAPKVEFVGADDARSSSTLTTEEVRTKLVAAAAQLDVVAAKRDKVFEELKKKYGGPNADPSQWIRHIEEMGRETGAAVPDDPWPELAPTFDALADTWLAATPDVRESMTADLLSHKSLHDGHLGYVSHVQKSIAAHADALSMRRVAAVVALGRGGRDFRDTFVQMEQFVGAARAAGIDPAPDFERVAATASATDKFGHGNFSTRDALLRFARTK